MNNHSSSAQHSPVIHPPSTLHARVGVGMYLEHLRDIFSLSRGARSDGMGRHDGQISPRVRTYSRGMLIPTRQFYASLFEAFLFQLLRSGGDHSTPRLELSSPIDSFSVYPLHFTPFHFTSFHLTCYKMGDSRRTNTVFYHDKQ